MAMKEEVAKRAEAEAERIVEEADERTQTMQREAEDYVDAKLAQFEISLRKILEEAQGTARGIAKTLDQVEVGRERLRAPATAAEQHLGGADDVSTPLYDEDDGAET